MDRAVFVFLHGLFYHSPRATLSGQVKFLAAEALRGVGGLVLDANGQRFCNELGRRDYVTGEMWKKLRTNPGCPPMEYRESSAHGPLGGKNLGLRDQWWTSPSVDHVGEAESMCHVLAALF